MLPAPKLFALLLTQQSQQNRALESLFRIENSEALGLANEVLPARWTGLAVV
jgi:hypothetical protein